MPGTAGAEVAALDKKRTVNEQIKTMARDQFRKYIWIVDRLYRTGACRIRNWLPHGKTDSLARC